MLRSSFSALVDIIFPPTCYACEQYEPLNPHLLCSICLQKLPWIYSSKDAIAALVGKDHFPLYVDYFDSLLYFTKESKVQQMIQEIKYNGQKKLAHYLGKRLGEKIVKEKPNWDQYELIPVPIHKKRRKERGYNQSNEIALGISQVIKATINNSVLARSVYEKSQTGKSKQERSEVLRSSFVINTKFEGQRKKKALLIDDVVTTGATVFSCTEILREIGYEEIGILTLAVSI